MVSVFLNLFKSLIAKYIKTHYFKTMRLCRATDNDISQLKTLWSEIFNSPKSFIDEFFEKRWLIDHCYVAKDKNNIVSAIHCLQFSYTRNMNITEVSYIVGCATKPNYRKQGLATSLLDLAHKDEGKILTLNSNLNPFFERHGFFYSSQNVCYPLKGNSLNPVTDCKEDISSIYVNATEETGSLDRDAYAWKLLRDNCKTIIVESSFQRAYALVIDDVAFETMCEGSESAKALKKKMEEFNISQVWMPSNSPLSYLFNTPPTFIPLGMSNEKNICSGIYIPQQF